MSLPKFIWPIRGKDEICTRSLKFKTSELSITLLVLKLRILLINERKRKKYRGNLKKEGKLVYLAKRKYPGIPFIIELQ